MRPERTDPGQTEIVDPGPAQAATGPSAEPVGSVGLGRGAAHGPIGIFHWAKAKRLFERGYFELVLRKARGNVAHAAHLSGIERRELYYKLHAHDLMPLCEELRAERRAQP